MRQKAQGAQPVVDRHDDDVVVLCQRGTVEEGAGPQHEAASVHGDDHRVGCAGGGLRAIDVQVQAVFAACGRQRWRRAGLHALRAGRAGVQRCRAGRRCCRWLPAQRAGRGRRIGDAEKLHDAVGSRAGDGTLLGLRHVGIRCVVVTTACGQGECRRGDPQRFPNHRSIHEPVSWMFFFRGTVPGEVEMLGSGARKDQYWMRHASHTFWI